MTNSTTIDIDGVGPVLFEHSKRAKRINISVKPSRGVRVAVPYGVSFKKALKFVHVKAEWVEKHLEKMKRYEIERKTIQDNLSHIDKSIAKRLLTGRLKHLAKKHGFTYNKVSIRNQKTRWGSCSARDNISLNMKLVVLPDELMDYVILHELVHTRRKDHSKRFWVELDKYVANGKVMASRLRKYGGGLL